MPGGKYSPQTPFFDLKEGYFVEELNDHIYFLKEEQAKLLHEFIQSDITSCHLIKIDRQERKALLRELITFYRLHIESFPTINAHQILEEVLEG